MQTSDVGLMEQLSPAMPFLGVLFSFAILPALRPKLWHRHMLAIILAWVALSFLLAAGLASAFLDAAPTYLLFFQAAGGDAVKLSAAPSHLLQALAAGTVFFGPLTYLGNARNLMVQAIATRRGVRMPGFLAYMLMMFAVMTPLFIIESLLFF